MRFGLSDLEELPSLKEFEALAREALGSDEGVAASEDYSAGVVASDVIGAARSGNGDAHATSAEAIGHVESGLASAEEWREHEALATAEGMPSGELDEDPPAPEGKAAAASGE